METARVRCRLRVFAWWSNLWGGATGKGGRQSEKGSMFKSGQTKVLRRFFLSVHCLRAPREERGVGFFRVAFVLWPAEWPSGKPEWAGRGFVQRHRVSLYFLHRCLLFVYLQNKRHGHLFLSLWNSPRSSLRFSCVCCPLLFKIEFIFYWCPCSGESTVL